MVYITAASIKEARKISKKLLAKRLVACTNIIPKIESHYKWKGKLVTSNEVVIIAKTNRKLVQKVIVEVKKLHSYEVPCIVSFKIDSGSHDFLKWVADQTKSQYSLV